MYQKREKNQSFLGLLPRSLVEKGVVTDEERYRPRFLRSFLLIHGPVKVNEQYKDYDNEEEAADDMIWDYVHRL